MKNKTDLSCTLVEMKFLLKGNKETITIHTTANDSCDFVDWLYDKRFEMKIDRNNPSLKFWVFDDLVKKETICIERDSIKTFSIPFYMNKEDGIKWKILQTL